MIRIGKEKNSYDNNQINQTFSMEILQTFLMPSAWLALLTLTFLEIVLGIDNIVFLSIMSTKVPPPVNRHMPVPWVYYWRCWQGSDYFSVFLYSCG